MTYKSVQSLQIRLCQQAKNTGIIRVLSFSTKFFLIVCPDRKREPISFFYFFLKGCRESIKTLECPGGLVFGVLYPHLTPWIACPVVLPLTIQRDGRHAQGRQIVAINRFRCLRLAVSIHCRFLCQESAHPMLHNHITCLAQITSNANKTDATATFRVLSRIPELNKT